MSGIEAQIELVQQKLIALSEPRPPPAPALPQVPIGPNLARGPDEMWKVYQYRLRAYQTLKTLPSETEFLEHLSNLTEHKPIIEKRLKQLEDKKHITHPHLELPMTKVAPLTWDQKVEKAKIIAQHILAEQRPVPSDDTDNEIKKLQKQLMQLEEQYLMSL